MRNTTAQTLSVTRMPGMERKWLKWERYGKRMNREQEDSNKPVRSSREDVYNVDPSVRRENRHRSQSRQVRQYLARKANNEPKYDAPKNSSLQRIGPGFLIPRYKRANYPDTILFQDSDPPPANRPIYDNFRHPKQVPKPANWELILEDYDRLWKLSRSYQLKRKT
ncbi:uncharacterized protein [Branchiostoma lanceolatum]|uniref:uncharacterized protein n=1 Tax=Branchiostoma lanceolatum TaxID=7740 RepID=UPI00345617D5